VPGIRSRSRREICVTVEEDGVWIYANRDGLRALADRIGALALSALTLAAHAGAMESLEGFVRNAK